MATVISIVNSKGGVGKSTSTVNLATNLAEKRKRVLVVDMDPQADTTSMLGITKERAGEGNIGHALVDSECFLQVLISSEYIKKDGRKSRKRVIDVCSSHSQLRNVYLSMISALNRERKLEECLDAVKDDYDYIIIDCPPDLGIGTTNALSASDYFVLVVDCDPLSMKNLMDITEHVHEVKKGLNPELDLLGVLFTKYEKVSAHKAVIESMSNYFSKKQIFKTIVPKNTKVRTCWDRPICSIADNSANQAYIKLASEINNIVLKNSKGEGR